MPSQSFCTPTTVIQAPIDAWFAVGGQHGVEEIIASLVERMVNDVMIGFFFAKVPRRRLALLEYQHAAAWLTQGHAHGQVTYRGRPIREAHARHTIFGGHFLRRRTLLREVLLAHNVREDIAHAWLGHQDALRELVVFDPHGACPDPF